MTKGDSFTAKLIKFFVLAGVIMVVVKKIKSMMKEQELNWEDIVPEQLRPENLSSSLASVGDAVHLRPKNKHASRTTKRAKKSSLASTLSNVFDLNSRQEKIYREIKDNIELKLTDFAEKIKDVSNRTLRRDMTKLEKLGLIEQIGKTKDSFYRLRK
jgi:DNA-binding transcriptional ArsR family regulator